MTDKPRVTLVGGGMITEIQILPTLYQLQREGVIGDLHICALQGAQLQALRNSPTLKQAFPSSNFVPHPDPAKVDPKQAFPDLFKEVLAKAPRGSICVVASPDHLHYGMIKEALSNDLHVCTVKPLVLKYAQAIELEKMAYDRGLVVGVEYHKRFDTRNLSARQLYRAGKFGEFKLAQAQMIEPWYYRDSNFQNWCTVENSDMFTYVGCHYVDLVAFITGLKPTSVSVYGIREKYPNGREGFLWTDGRVIWENGASLSVVDAMGYPNRAAGGNAQGLTMWCGGRDDAGLLVHSDQYRGVKHHYDIPDDDGKRYSEPNPDYFRLIAQGGEGLTPSGYGHRSVEFIIKQCRAGSAITDLKERQKFIKRLDADGIMATPANSSYNELVIEAGRKSILAGGREVVINYEKASVDFKQF
jgi:predicted dehydrogenase